MVGYNFGEREVLFWMWLSQFRSFAIISLSDDPQPVKVPRGRLSGPAVKTLSLTQL
jgi:hypothetical protein